MKAKVLSIFALLCTMVQGAWADEWATVYTQTQTTSANWTALNGGSTTGHTLGSAGSTTYYYATGNLGFTNSNAGGSGLTIKGTVYLYIPSGVTLTCTGANASGATGAGAGIELAEGNSLYLIGSGTVTATGGNAAKGGDGQTGANATGDGGSWIYTGSGGPGGYGGGGAGAGIGTRGGDGGAGGGGGEGYMRYDDWSPHNGTNGTSGSAGYTAGAMGAVYVYQAPSTTVNATGGIAGSSGSGGGRGKGYTYDGGYNYSSAGGGGGGAGGFGGAASNIGTGGAGGGGGGGGGGGAVDDKGSGVYDVTAHGGKGGQNAGGTKAADGEDAPTTGDAYNKGWVSGSSWGGGDWNPASGHCLFGDGGDGGTCGSATTTGTTGSITVDWTTQENDWGLICLQTKTKRADWVHLTDGSTIGKTLGAAGTTTYYYTAADRTFTNINAGGSGLTIQGTVYLYIPSGKTITCTGANATAPAGGGAGIELTAGNTLYLIGSGKLVATGGNAANGTRGGNGGDATRNGNDIYSGGGGRGGDGGGGAGAGIGTRGGNGGNGGTGGVGGENDTPKPGNAGSNGYDGSTAAEMGTLYIYEGSQTLTPQTDIQGGSQGTSGNGGFGGRHGLFGMIRDTDWYLIESYAGGGGGGGGGFGGAASNIGTGGPGGGGGGGGASGSTSYSWDYNFHQVGAFGGAGGVNGDGTTAHSGDDTMMKSTSDLSECVIMDDHIKRDQIANADWQKGDNRAAGGRGGGSGSASTSGAANTVTAGWPTQGLGTEGDPFIISSTEDWNAFANIVNGGSTFSGQFVKLTNNISVSTMAGTGDANSFQGTFDGNGNTQTVNYNTTENNTAPFRHVKNATIKNLHVDGTIATSAPYAGGIVSESHGALTLTGCVSSVSINSSKSSNADHGGLVSVPTGAGNTITIDGCVFDGSFATTNGTIACGGFVGWGVYSKPVIKNSLLKPTSVDANMLGSTFARWYTGENGIYKPDIDNCYYVATENLPTDQGTQAYALATATDNLGDLVKDYGLVEAYENGILYDGTYYAPSDTDEDEATGIIEVHGSGSMVQDTDAWYTLGGHRLAGKPSRAGVYINNGAKRVIK